MRSHPFLSPIEAAVIRWISRSPRIGYVLIKQHSSPVTWLLRDETDLTAPDIEEDYEDDDEPLSMQFERLYHLPDATR